MNSKQDNKKAWNEILEYGKSLFLQGGQQQVSNPSIINQYPFQSTEQGHMIGAVYVPCYPPQASQKSDLPPFPPQGISSSTNISQPNALHDKLGKQTGKYSKIPEAARYKNTPFRKKENSAGATRLPITSCLTPSSPGKIVSQRYPHEVKRSTFTKYDPSIKLDGDFSPIKRSATLGTRQHSEKEEKRPDSYYEELGMLKISEITKGRSSKSNHR